MTRKHSIRFYTLSVLALMTAFSAMNTRATSASSAHDIAKTTVKAPVVAAPKAEDDETEAKKDDVKTKPAPKPKPKPKPGPRDDGDGD